MTPRLTVQARPTAWRTSDGITHVMSRAAAPCGADLDSAPNGSSQAEADCMACIASGARADTIMACVAAEEPP